MFKSNKSRFNQFEQDRLLALFQHVYHNDSGLPGFRKKGFCLLNRDTLGDTFDKLFDELIESQNEKTQNVEIQNGEIQNGKTQNDETQNVGKFQTKYENTDHSLSQIQVLVKVLGGTLQDYECAAQDYIGTRVLKAMNCDVAYDIPVVLDDEDGYPQFYILSADFLKKDDQFLPLGDLSFYANYSNTPFDLFGKHPKLFSALCSYGAKVDILNAQKISDEFIRQYLVRTLVLIDYDADFKNFGIILSSDKTPRCAPAFDLEFALNIPGETPLFDETISRSLENAHTKKILQCVVNDANKNLLDGTFARIFQNCKNLRLYPDSWSQKTKAEDEYGVERNLCNNILWLNKAVRRKQPDMTTDIQQIEDYVNAFKETHRKSKELESEKETS